MQFPPVPRYLVPPRSKYSPQRLILKHPQPPFLPQCQRPSFTPIQSIVVSTELKEYHFVRRYVHINSNEEEVSTKTK